MEIVSHILQFMGELVDRVTKMDPANLVWILAILLGYVLKWVKVFPNQFIPVASLVATVSSYIVMVAVPGQPLKKFVTDVVLGIIFWGFAWGVHAAVLKKWIDEKLFKGATGNTAFIQKMSNNGTTKNDDQ